MLGQSSVGKTSIFTRATEPDDLPTAIPNTIGVGFGLKKWRGKRFAIWDTAGQEKFYCLVPMYSRDSNALVLVYALYLNDETSPIDLLWIASTYFWR
eukprot:TRINITY_DN4149_c0_g1_i2.p1 TRINITY_DN4149_c0_g1~~TRINITY_DN4149_c0_g1_i2.p1  ORF type:complete len:112 (-),score=15.86 TRINITY_DN4149_c0_g1_i2:455-745(-)